MQYYVSFDSLTLLRLGEADYRLFSGVILLCLLSYPCIHIYIVIMQFDAAIRNTKVALTDRADRCLP